MENLNNYVDFWQYCNTLSDITQVDIDVVIQIVRTAFSDINNGIISSEKGFQRIEYQLTQKSDKHNLESRRRSRTLTRMGEIPPTRAYAKSLRA